MSTGEGQIAILAKLADIEAQMIKGFDLIIDLLEEKEKKEEKKKSDKL